MENSVLQLLHKCSTGLMEMRKFKLPKNSPTTSKSVRFPNDVIEQIEDAIRGTDCTFSTFVVEAARVALEDLKEDSQKVKE